MRLGACLVNGTTNTRWMRPGIWVRRHLAVFIAPIVVLSSAAAHGATVTVFAAASLTDSLKEIAAAYEKESGDRIRFNFGASSFLARQIEEGAPADIFFSADEAKMNALERKGWIVKETRRDRLSNSLVIVLPADSRITFRFLHDITNATVGRLALADPGTVPAGIYARRLLEKSGLWRHVENRVVPTDNVRAALAAVASGNIDAGIVYKTDASISKQVKVALEIPADRGPAIRYPMALVRETGKPAASRKFLRHLESAAAADVFAKFGFIVLPIPGK